MSDWRTRAGAVFAYEDTGHLWVLDTPATRSLMAGIEYRPYPATALRQDVNARGKRRYGRHSALKGVPELSDSDLIRFTPSSMAEVHRILLTLPLSDPDSAAATPQVVMAQEPVPSEVTATGVTRPHSARHGPPPGNPAWRTGRMTVTSLFAEYLPAVRGFTGAPDARDLLIAADGDLSVHYVPFDWINHDARVVLVGITPGRTQAVNALREAQHQLRSGSSEATILMRAKQAAAFSGPMRSRLTDMLDHIGLHQWLNIPGSATLFTDHSNLLQTASVLQYPVFITADGNNYSGTPTIAETPLLREMAFRFFCPVARALPQAVFIPLGPVPTKTMEWLTRSGHIRARVVLAGLPHPSGANARTDQLLPGKETEDESCPRERTRRGLARHGDRS